MLAMLFAMPIDGGAAADDGCRCLIGTTHPPAVLVVSPYALDDWDAGPWYWGQRTGNGDAAFFSLLFEQLAAGAFG